MRRSRRQKAASRGSGPPRAADRPPRAADRLDAELRAFHAALMALPVPEALRRLVREAGPASDKPFDREGRR